MENKQEPLGLRDNKGELIPIGERTLSTSGFRTVLALEHLRSHLETRSRQWCAIGCLVRTFEGRNTKKGRQQMRRRLAPLFRAALNEGLFLTIEYEERSKGKHGKAVAIKLFSTKHDEKERAYAREQLRRMSARKEITIENFERANQLLLSFESGEEVTITN